MRHGICPLRSAALVGLLAIGGAALGADASTDLCVRAGTEQDSGKQTLVMVVLSPRMPYALKEWPRMKKVAEDAGFEVQGVSDPRVPYREWAMAVQAAGAPELLQAPVIDRDQAAAFDALNHAPASLVIRCGQAHRWPVLGIMPDSAWVAVLRAREAQLKHSTCC